MPKSRTRKPSGGHAPRRERPRLDVELGAVPVEAGEAIALVVATDVDGIRHAAVMPRSVARLPEESIAVLRSLQRNVLATQHLTNQLDYLVDQARDEGASWAAIGWSVGTTGEAARQRWGDFDTAQEPRR